MSLSERALQRACELELEGNKERAEYFFRLAETLEEREKIRDAMAKELENRAKELENR